jgi:hypothetical protein
VVGGWGEGEGDGEEVEVLREEGVEVGFARAGVPGEGDGAAWVADWRGELVAVGDAGVGGRARVRRVCVDFAAEGGEDAGNLLKRGEWGLVWRW